MLKCKITKLAETIYPLIHADIPVMIKGPTGVGKSAVINTEVMTRIRTDFGQDARLHDIRLSTKDVVDATGMPLINREEMATYWTRPAFVPAEDGEMHVMFFDEFGHCSETAPKKWWGWFMQAPLLFDPTGGVFFDTQTNEGTKLTKLGSEGRSTSTTITAFSLLNQLNDAGYHSKDQKLLSFTDNRQDAALQAGHFNDFVQVVRLRSGIHKALKDAPGNTFNYAKIGRAHV